MTLQRPVGRSLDSFVIIDVGLCRFSATNPMRREMAPRLQLTMSGARQMSAQQVMVTI